MSISKPANAVDLKSFIKAKLGSPIINIEISDPQYDILIVETLDKFHEYVYEANTKEFIKATFTVSTDTESTGAEMPGVYTMPEDTVSVIGVYPMPEILQKNLYNATLGLDQIVGSVEIDFDYSPLTGIIKLSKTISAEEYLYVQYYKKIDEDTYGAVFNHIWLKKYAVALAKIQWGTNLIKYSSVPIPGGMELNGDAILNEGKEEKVQLEEELFESYSETPLPQMH